MLEHSIPHLAEATRRRPRGHSDEALGWTAVDVIAGGTGIVVVPARDANNRKWLFSVDMEAKELQVMPHDQIKAYDRTIRTFTYTLPWPRFLRPALAPS